MPAREPRDLGLSYLDAMHGMQSGVAHEMNVSARAGATDPKHLRVGVNATMCDHAALARLLIAKGLIAEAEYLEAIRVQMNEELAQYQERHPGVTFR